MRNYLVIGGSRGLGAALAEKVADRDDKVWLVSRKRPNSLDLTDGIERHWLKVDLTDEKAADALATAVGDNVLDVLIYNAGIWEEEAFSDRYNFEQVSRAENHRVLLINLTAVIDCVQVLIPAVRKSANGKIIIIGSTSGLENVSGPEVAYSASKFGVRGVVHALRENLRGDQIGVTTINPGTIATEYALDSDVSLEKAGEIGIPLIDLVKVVRCVVDLSPYSCLKEIDIPAMIDTHA